MENINLINPRLVDNVKPHKTPLVQPYVMSLNGSFIVTDPKGITLEENIEILRQNGYSVKTINLLETENFYNPSAYIREEANR